VEAFRNPIQPNVQATLHSYQFTPVQTQNSTIKHNDNMKMALDIHLLQSINITAFFLTYLLSNFSQTYFVERVMSFVLGNTNTPFPRCFFLVAGKFLVREGNTAW